MAEINGMWLDEWPTSSEERPPAASDRPRLKSYLLCSVSHDALATGLAGGCW